MRTFTEDQINKHGELITKHIQEGVDIQVKTIVNGWTKAEHPEFHLNFEYREAPEPLYVNSIGEKFYEGDLVWYGNTGKGDNGYIDNYTIDSTDLGDFGIKKGVTEIFKTKSRALKAASDHYKTKGE